MLESRVREFLPVTLRAPLFGALAGLWPASARLPKPLRLKTIFGNLAVGDAEAFYRDLAWLDQNSRKALYSSDFLKSLHGFTPMETVASYYVHNDAQDALGRSQFTDVSFYMTEDVLVKVDRMSMAHSLEVRCPLLDHHILEFAARLPSTLKISGSKGKLPLRELAARRLPPEIAPTRWLRRELRPMAEDLMFSERNILSDLFNMTKLSQLWNEHLSGARDHHVLFWGLMMLRLWQQTSQMPSRSIDAQPRFALHA